MPNFDLDGALTPDVPLSFIWSVPVEDAMHYTIPRGLSLAEHLTDLSSEQEEFTPEIGATAWSGSVEVVTARNMAGDMDGVDATPYFAITVSAGDPI